MSPTPFHSSHVARRIDRPNPRDTTPHAHQSLSTVERLEPRQLLSGTHPAVSAEGAAVGTQYDLHADLSARHTPKHWVISWGDGTTSKYNAGKSSDFTHDYAASGLYTVKAVAVMPNHRFRYKTKTIATVGTGASPPPAASTLPVTTKTNGEVMHPMSSGSGSSSGLTVTPSVPMVPDDPNNPDIITITRPDPTNAGCYTIVYDGGAVNGTDFSAPTSVHFDAGVSTQYVTIYPIRHYFPLPIKWIRMRFWPMCGSSSGCGSGCGSGSSSSSGSSGSDSGGTIIGISSDVIPPSNLSATGDGPNSINVTWQDNDPNASSYIIERADNANGAFAEAGPAPAGATSFEDTGAMLPLTADTTYRYEVAAVANSLQSPFSNVDTGTTTSANGEGGNGGRLIGYSGDPNAGTTPGVAQTWLTIQPVNGYPNQSNMQSSTGRIHIQAAANYTPVTTNISQFQFGVVSASNPGSYNSPLWLQGGATSVALTTTAPAQTYTLDANVPAYTNITVLSQGSVNSADGTRVNNPTLNVYDIDPLPTWSNPAPYHLSAMPASKTSINLSWLDSSGINNYTIERSTDNVTWQQIDTVSGATTYTDIHCSQATQYWYRVRAYLGSAYTAYSNSDAATTFDGATGGATLIGKFITGTTGGELYTDAFTTLNELPVTNWYTPNIQAYVNDYYTSDRNTIGDNELRVGVRTGGGYYNPIFDAVSDPATLTTNSNTWDRYFLYPNYGIGTTFLMDLQGYTPGQTPTNELGMTIHDPQLQVWAIP